MTTITLSNSTIRNAEKYAKQHNISVADAIERGVTLLLGKLHNTKSQTKSTNFQEALSYVKSLKPQGGRPVPAGENGQDAFIEQKGYKL